MEDNMKMSDDIKITEVDKTEEEDLMDGIDKEAASFILNKVAEAIIKEYTAMQDVLKTTKENEVNIDKQLDEIEKEVSDINKDIEVQVGVINSLERRMKNEKEDAVIKSLMGIRDETVAYIEQLRNKLDEYSKSVADVESNMRKIKESELYLTIASEVLINFGMKYGLVSESKDE